LSIPNRPQKQPPIEKSDKESTFTVSPPFPSPGLFRTGEKKGHPQSSPEKENQKPIKKTTKQITTTPSTPSIPPYSLSPGQHLSSALDSLIQAYTGLEDEDKDKEEVKEQVEQLVYYTRRILLGESPFIQEKERRKKRKSKQCPKRTSRRSKSSP